MRPDRSVYSEKMVNNLESSEPCMHLSVHVKPFEISLQYSAKVVSKTKGSSYFKAELIAPKLPSVFIWQHGKEKSSCWGFIVVHYSEMFQRQYWLPKGESTWET